MRDFWLFVLELIVELRTSVRLNKPFTEVDTLLWPGL